MKRHVFVSIGVVLALTLSGIAQTKFNSDGPSWCGTERGSANISLEARKQMNATAAAFQANDLLLYINFNQTGTVVRQGFGNADTLTSSIISGSRSCPPPSLTQEQKDEILRLVRDDYSPFNIRVTTDAAEFAAYPRALKEMCLITTFPSVIGHPSSTLGVSPFTFPGNRLPGDFAFVFSNAIGGDPKDVAAVVYHESGHLLGLAHQNLFDDSCGLIYEYHHSFGLGVLAFSPIMGDGLGNGITNWFAQSCQGSFFGLPQNDYELINSQVTVKSDDFPDEPTGDIVDATEITGLLERAGDTDFIKINFKNPGALSVTSDNIDLKVSLVTAGGKVLEEYNDPDQINVALPSAKGLRFLKIEAESNANMSAQFMTGTYKVVY